MGCDGVEVDGGALLWALLVGVCFRLCLVCWAWEGA